MYILFPYFTAKSWINTDKLTKTSPYLLADPCPGYQAWWIPPRHPALRFQLLCDLDDDDDVCDALASSPSDSSSLTWVSFLSSSSSLSLPPPQDSLFCVAAAFGVFYYWGGVSNDVRRRWGNATSQDTALTAAQDHCLQDLSWQKYKNCVTLRFHKKNYSEAEFSAIPVLEEWFLFFTLDFQFG